MTFFPFNFSTFFPFKFILFLIKFLIISGFYFLKASEKTSLPLFEDPRPGNLMNGLPELDKSKVTYASTQINYQVEPGSMIFFPSYMPHQYVVDMGYEPFRFIHWNCQAIPKAVLNA